LHHFKGRSWFAVFLAEGAMTLRRDLEPFTVDDREAGRVVQDLLDDAVAALRRDRRFAGIRLFEFDLILADVRGNAERRLFEKLRDRVHLDDVDYVAGDGE
jgi:hypothetical protein